jgi:hypothetical protein
VAKVLASGAKKGRKFGQNTSLQWNVTETIKKYDQKTLAKTLVPSYYCLYSLFNKIRDKGKIVSAW